MDHLLLQSHSVRIVNNGVEFVLSYMGYTAKGTRFVSSMARSFWSTPIFSFLEGCTTLHNVVPLVGMKCEML